MLTAFYGIPCSKWMSGRTFDAPRSFATGSVRQRWRSHGKCIVRSAGMYVPSDRCARHLEPPLEHVQINTIRHERLWLRAALEGSLQSERRLSCCAPCLHFALPSEPLRGSPARSLCRALYSITCFNVHVLPWPMAVYMALRLIRRQLPRLRRIVLAQMEGSGRGSLGAYNAQGYDDLSSFLADQPMRSGDAWLEALLKKNEMLGERHGCFLFCFLSALVLKCCPRCR